ncbi:sigma-70 family RNA polymerase sigma factor [Allokutzneria sp. A3M-2-11 16]|uniref:RNA polymerase sigma factor n=1 Tax=Allokutzneria sp. A3M-2-11 16 TaxID=2962043 RepID=UPI0020B63AC4|nr:sigma-70 family RNA polymerase sigma factor [Allokutzneria sp. A3M-2-11 16]MCP3804024.1 sigma-70 family RNA polymerase sigma factor [Allokutzneria sp. A3M-2-11 16]
MDQLRELTPQVLGALVRRYGHFDLAEDAVQEALLAAATQWPREGVPDNPRAWLITVASRRLTDLLRQDEARRRRETTVAALEEPLVPEDIPADDDTLELLALCCHPALSQVSQVALTLRAVGGLTTAEIARAFLVPETTMAQRISRAKQRVRGAAFAAPEDMAPVLGVLYLIFTEGHTASSGDRVSRADLTSEAIRLTRLLHRALPEDGEVTGLLALMLLTEARRAARTRQDGTLVPLAEQDRLLWDRALIAEGTTLITQSLQDNVIGPYQVQAAIAAVHAEAPGTDETDWPQIVALYGLLTDLTDNPMITLNHAVAVAAVDGPRAGLDLLAPLDEDPRVAGHHRLSAVRGHLLEQAGDQEAALACYRRAAERTASEPERRYLSERVDLLTGAPTTRSRPDR